MPSPELLLQGLGLGVLEAATEFLPVSSTGHLLLAGHFLGFEGPPGKVFEIAIQLGAVLAICVLYFQKLWGVAVNLPHRTPQGEQARRFALAVLLAFLPAAVVGVLAHDLITEVLFNPWVVCTMLVLGGVVILWVEQPGRVQPTTRSVEAMGWPLALKIGVLQCVAMIPGVSRSGATIMGALWLGMERKAATEFSFFLAIPTMLGATVYSLAKRWDVLEGGDLILIGAGFLTAFVVALGVVRWLLRFVATHTFRPFAWYRIVVGSGGLVALGLVG